MKNKKKNDSINELESEISFTKHFLEESVMRGKALDIILPLVSTEHMAELLEELYNFRVKEKSDFNNSKKH